MRSGLTMELRAASERIGGRAPPPGGRGAGGEAVGARDVPKLTSAIAGGDAEAFALLYEAWFDRAYRLARLLTRRDEAFCLDVVEDAMLRAIRAIRPMADIAALDRWMARVVETAAIDGLRRDARRARREGRACAGAPSRTVEPEGPAALEREEEIAWLRSRISRLPAAERLLLAERFGAGKTFEEAGAATGLTGDAASGRIRRILERLRKTAREVFHGDR